MLFFEMLYPDFWDAEMDVTKFGVGPLSDCTEDHRELQMRDEDMLKEIYLSRCTTLQAIQPPSTAFLFPSKLQPPLSFTAAMTSVPPLRF